MFPSYRNQSVDLQSRAVKRLMVINHFVTMNPQTNQIWIKIKQNNKRNGWLLQEKVESNTRERYVQEL